MDKRTKILAACLIGLVVLWGGKGVIIGYLVDPIQSKRAALRAADKNLRRLRDEQFKIEQTEKQLKEWTSRSLPHNDIDAQRLYKEWLTQLGDVVGFDGLQVKAERRDEQKVGRGGGKKKVVYRSLQVSLTGRTTFSRLNRFLYYFHRTKLMHRINDLRITSESNNGDPMLTVKMTAEALSFESAKDRMRLFPETELAADATSTDFVVKDSKDFPKKGEFHVRIGRDLLTVTERNKNIFKYRPGVDPAPQDPNVPPLEKTGVDPHAKNERVELTPLLPAGTSNLLTYYRDVFGPGKSPFVLPAPPPVYRPKLIGVRDQRIGRRDRLRMRVEAVDLDPKKGKATYALGKSDLKDLTIDPNTGSISWEPKKEDEAKTYLVEVLAHQGGGKDPILKDTVRITLTDPNRAPILERISDQSIMIGRTLRFSARASDPDEEDRRNLKFSLSGAPAGASIGTYSGEFSWTPTEADVAGDYTITVSVSDGRSRDARSDERRIRIRLLEDTTRFVNLIAILTDGGEREAWLYDHSTKTKTVVKEGLPFKVAGISGFVFVIGDGFVEFRSDGATWRIKSGDSLAARQLMSAPVPKAVASKKTDADKKPDKANTPDATKKSVAGNPAGSENGAPVSKERKPVVAKQPASHGESSKKTASEKADSGKTTTEKTSSADSPIVKKQQ